MGACRAFAEGSQGKQIQFSCLFSGNYKIGNILPHIFGDYIHCKPDLNLLYNGCS